MTPRSLWLVILATACTATHTFNGIGGSGPDDVWVVGGMYGAEGGTDSPILSHWDGRSWTSQHDTAVGALNAAWSSSANDVWLAGESSTVHYDGSSWTTPTTEIQGARAVWGDGTGAVWVVGYAGNALRYDAPGTPPNPYPNPNSGVFADLNGVWGSGANDVWAVGEQATIAHWQGTSWTTMPAPIAASTALLAISGSASNDVWSVGRGGAIVHWDGATWSAVPSGTTADLLGVWADGGADVWAVGGAEGNGRYGVVLHFDGVSWTQAYRGGADLYAVWGTSYDNVYAVGDDLTVVHWNGTKWTSQQLSP